MKILLVTNGLPSNDPGGVQCYTLSLAHQLSKSHEVSILTRVWDLGKPEYQTEEYCLGDVRIYSVVKNVGYPADFQLSYVDEKIDGIFSELIKKIQPEIIHVQHLIFLSANIINLAVSSNIPIALTLHDFWYICPAIRLLTPDMKPCPCLLQSNYSARCYHDHFYISQATTPFFSNLPPVIKKLFPHFLKTAIKNILQYIGPKSRPRAELTEEERRSGQRRADFMHDALGKVSAIIAPSQFVGNLYHTWGVAAGMDVIPHGIDTIRTIPGKKVTPAGIHFGYIGTISEFKGVDILIKAFMNVTGDEASLSVYGDFQSATQYYRSLKKISRNDKRIHFHGAYDTKQLGDILSTIDVVVVPTRCNESFNMVIREAFSQKIPVIASRIGAIPEIVKDNINGMMFEPGNIVQLSQKMQALLERPAQVRQFARNAPPIKYIADHAREIENVYNRLLISFNR